MSKVSGVEYRVSYAQNREDIILNGIIGGVKHGFYVDVGANQPIEDSVTFLFYKKGWNGINIEPIKGLYELLVQERPRDINLNIGIGSKRGSLDLRVYKGREGLSTFSPDMKKEYIEHDDFPFQDIKIPVYTLKDILKKHAALEIHFMKIDVEGFEQEVIKGNDWDTFRPWVICIEANHVFQSWSSILEKHNYEEVFFDGLNRYYLAKEKDDLMKNFSYPETMLSSTVVTQKIGAILKDRGETENRLEEEIENLQTKMNEQRATIEYLEHQVRESKLLKPAIKQTIKAADSVILRRLQKIGQSPTPRVVDTKDISSTSTDSVKGLLKAVRINDLNSLYTTRGHSRVLQQLPYAMYRGTTRKSIHILRQLKHKIKNPRG